MKPVLPLSNLLPQIVRTVVAYLYPLFGPWLLRNLGLDVDDFTALTTIVVGAVIYAVLAVVEKFVPQVGVLLGWTRQPVYAKTGPDGVQDITSLDAGGSA